MIVLASGSWLRKTILDASNLKFKIHIKDVDERAIEAQHADKSDGEVATILAHAKAVAVLKDNPNDLIIAADTLVILPSGERLHKPSSAEEAIELCLQQSGKTITAITGIAMAFGERVTTNVSTTKITYSDFDRETITELLKGDDPTIRNSGLGFFSDAPGFTLVKSFNGSYTGAMGLPMEIVRENLVQLGYADGDL